MPEFGFPAQPRQASIRSLIANLRDRSDDARFEASTERFADVTRELNGRVNELMQIEKSINDLQGYAEAIALAEGRSTVMQQSMDLITGAAQTIADTADLLLTNGTDRDLATLSAQADAQLDSVIASMNSQFAGRFLFTGDTVDGSAIAEKATVVAASLPFLTAGPSGAISYANLEAQFIGAGGVFDSVVYTGGVGDAALVEVAPGERVAYSAKADETGMRRALFNMVVMSAAFDPTNGIPEGDRRALVREASAGLRESISEIIQIQSRVGSAEARIATIKSRNIASEASLTISYNDLAGADQFAAALSLTQLEDQLEVAFSTTSRLANLTLANFR